jgi:serine kinase of HPr protein (carbohydrate metabolism regulator)
MIRHAGLIARRDPAGQWRGALIEGPSGCGKSDLALRAIQVGWSLIADDRTLIWRSGDALYGRAPDALAGLIEARGLAVIAAPYRAYARICLLARCMQGCEPERSPEDRSETVLGLPLPLFELTALEASAPVKLGHALTCIGLKPQPAYLALRARTRATGVGGIP